MITLKFIIKIILMAMLMFADLFMIIVIFIIDWKYQITNETFNHSNFMFQWENYC